MQGSHVLQLVLDPENEIAEINENNNTYSIIFNVADGQKTSTANIHVTSYNTIYGGELISYESADFDPQNAPITILDPDSNPIISWQGGPVQSVQVIDFQDYESGALYGITSVNSQDDISPPVRYGDYSISGTKVLGPNNLFGNFHVPSPSLKPGVNYLIYLWKAEHTNYLTLTFYYTLASGKPVKGMEGEIDFDQNNRKILELLSKENSTHSFE